VTEPGEPGELEAGLLARWGVPADATVDVAERGTNNHTVAVTAGGRRWALRISQNLTLAQVRAEHRLLARLAGAGLPFAVPAPLPLPGGDTIADTPVGPATLCPWIPGVRPDLSREPALERFGRAAAELSGALAGVPAPDAPQPWPADPLRVHPDVPDVTVLTGELTAAGLRPGALRAAADQVAAWSAGPAGRLPAQVTHADLNASNVLVSEDTGAVTGVLDFETAGCWLRANELAVALAQAGAAYGPGWPARAAAVARGGAWGERLTGPELAALPDLILLRSVVSAMWRAAQWRRGRVGLTLVAARLDTVGERLRWHEDNGGELAQVVATAR
jgi:homoserine kinase type II